MSADQFVAHVSAVLSPVVLMDVLASVDWSQTLSLIAGVLCLVSAMVAVAVACARSSEE